MTKTNRNNRAGNASHRELGFVINPGIVILSAAKDLLLSDAQ